jgi:hypothetical protein
MRKCIVLSILCLVFLPACEDQPHMSTWVALDDVRNDAFRIQDAVHALEEADISWQAMDELSDTIGDLRALSSQLVDDISALESRIEALSR